MLKTSLLAAALAYSPAVHADSLGTVRLVAYIQHTNGERSADILDSGLSEEDCNEMPVPADAPVIVQIAVALNAADLECE